MLVDTSLVCIDKDRGYLPEKVHSCQSIRPKRVQRRLSDLVALDLAVVNSAGSAGGRAVDQERRALDLLDVVETGDADVAIREGLDGSLDFGEDFVGVLAAVHRELPHNPVAVVVVARVDGGVKVGPAVAVSVGVGFVFELDARSPAVVEQVLDLLGDFGIGERRQEGEGLEHPKRRRRKEEERNIGQSSRS